MASEQFYLNDLTKGDKKVSEKTKWLSEMNGAVRDFIELRKKVDDIFQTYFDKGFNSGGADELVAGDLTGTPWDGAVTMTEIGNTVTGFEQYLKFMDNEAVTTGDYSGVFNAVKI